MNPSDSDTIFLAAGLIRRPSITPADTGCQTLIADRLKILGFAHELMPVAEVTNSWFRRGLESPLFVFAGHTDVVPPGPENQWRFPPFEPTLEDGRLYGRGASDMKGGIAAFITACERFIAHHPNHRGSIALLITSDEEGPALNGTRAVVETLANRHERIDWCLIGEPTSSQLIADTIKNGRRGSLSGMLRIIGKQGHIAYPNLARNPIHSALPALMALVQKKWDKGNAHFPPTAFQISNIHSGTGAGNVIPGSIDISFNFRFSTALTVEKIQQEVVTILRAHQLEYELQWTLSGQPFLTPEGRLVRAAQQTIRKITGRTAVLSTSGGTSDGRFIAPTGTEVIELGPINATIHQINEYVSCADLNQLSLIYEGVLKYLLLPA